MQMPAGGGQFEDLDVEQVEDPNAGKSLQDMMREKTGANEEFLSKNKPQKESVEERQARLKAQRDKLIKMKQEQRQKDLGDFKQDVAKDDLHSQLRKLDERTKAKQATSGSAFSQHLDELEGESPDKRLALYHKMREELMQNEQKEKEDIQKRKLEELNNKIDKLEKDKTNKAKQKEEEEKAKEDKRGQSNAAFLSNIKSFDVGIEDF